MERDTTEFRIKFVNDDKDLLVRVPSPSTFSAVAAQIRQHKGWSPNKHVRLVCAGRELYADDPTDQAAGTVLHCIAVEAATGGNQTRKKSGHSHDAALDAAQVDWLEVVDPGTVLMWIFGSILALLWLMFVFYADMFDKTSVVMLCMMTIAFLIPCVLSYMPCLPLLHGSSRAAALAGAGGGAGHGSQGYHHTYAAPTAISRPSSAAAAQPWLYTAAVPPRPRARPPPQVES